MMVLPLLAHAPPGPHRRRSLYLAAAVTLLACDHPRPSPVPSPPSPPAAQADPPTPPVSPFRVVAEGANGDDQHYSPLRTMCPVHGAVLMCGHHGPLLHASATAGMTVFDRTRVAHEVHGQWPSHLWAISAEEQFVYAFQQSPTGWIRRARIGVNSDVTTHHQSTLWGDGGLAILTTSLRSQSHPVRNFTTTSIRTITREGVVLQRSLAARQGQPLVSYGFSIHALGTHDLLVAGQTGGKAIMDGLPALFVWRGASPFPEPLALPDARCLVDDMHGASDDVHIFGQRDTPLSGVPCGYQLTPTGFIKLSLPPSRGAVSSYSRAPDGTQWLILREETHQLLGHSTLWSRQPNATWEPVSLPAPVLSRTKRWGPVLPQRVHVADDGRVWIDAIYRERCGRSLLLATDATAPPCRLEMSEALCTPTPDQEHRYGACPEVN